MAGQCFVYLALGPCGQWPPNAVICHQIVAALKQLGLAIQCGQFHHDIACVIIPMGHNIGRDIMQTQPRQIGIDPKTRCQTCPQLAPRTPDQALPSRKSSPISE